GKAGFRLVYLTPPIVPVAYADRSEARWSPAEMPFCYQSAPLVLDGTGASDIPALRQLVAGGNRNGWRGKFARAFRARREPLPGSIAAALVAVYESARRSGQFASRYEDALPVNPPLIDRKRRSTYRRLLDEAVALSNPKGDVV